MPRFVNDRRRHKKEDEELGARDNRIVIAPYEQDVTLRAAHDAIRAKQAKRPERAKKGELMPADRDQDIASNSPFSTVYPAFNSVSRLTLIRIAYRRSNLGSGRRTMLREKDRAGRRPSA
jgi:hypothetical protein